MLERYYQAELSYLREAGHEFAGKYPAVAGMLAAPGTDPDVERLLEGFAFVAAGLKQRIDDSYPELIEGLSELLFPHIVRPTPACTILELSSTVKAVRGRMRIAAGSRVLSRPVRGSSCTFVTSRAADLLPLRVLSSQLEAGTTSRPSLSVSLEGEAGAEEAIFCELPLRFHLAGEWSMTSQLLLWLTRHLKGVSVVCDDQVVELPPQGVRSIGFADDDTLFPWPSFSPHGARILLEYFSLPSKFMFFEVRGLERARSVASTRFKLVFHFTAPPPLSGRLPEDSVRLHCVPACNVFEVDAEPIRRSLDERPVLLRAAGLDPSAMEVFSVRTVTGATRNGTRRRYEPFYSFRHRTTEPGTGLYTLSRRASPVDDGMHTYLSVQAPATGGTEEDEVLSVQLLCTNRSLVAALQQGDISLATPDLAPGVVVRNLGSISSTVRPVYGGALPWHLLSHLGCSRRALVDLPILKSLLSMYCAGNDHQPSSRANLARIDAIQSVRASTITRALSGVAATGSRYVVELEQAAFAGVGDAFAFGLVLHKVLRASTQLNSFADLALVLLPSAFAFRYDAELLE